MLKYFLVFLLLFIFLSVVYSKDAPEVITGFIIKVYDGDTATMISCAGDTHKIRLAKIDTPELKQEFGKQAKACLADKILNQRVHLHILARDMYRRDVGEIYQAGQSVNRQLVEEGCAWVYEAYNDDETLMMLQEKARLEKKGLWAADQPMPPWTWRKMRKTQ